ncbi:hypothetical protein I8B06_003816 [Vibrio vulnificus]|nr:hypothetical protein [Vibrio vulnificus]
MSDKEIVCIGGFNITKYKKRAEAEKTLRQEYESEVSSKVLNSLCREFNGWLSSGDTDYLDEAVSLLYANKAPIKGVLLDEVGKLANARLSGEVKESTGDRKKIIESAKDKIREIFESKAFKTKSGRNKAFVTEPAIENVFDLVEICGFNQLPAFFYAACINEKKKGTPFFKSIKAGRLRKLYGDYKKTDDYNLFISNLEQYKEIKYPNMTNKDIEHLITKGEVFCEKRYSHLLESGKEDFKYTKKDKKLG